MNPLEDMNRRAREAEGRAQQDWHEVHATRPHLNPRYRSVDTAGVFVAALIVAVIVLLLVVL